MRTALKELEQASYNHDQWAEMLYSTLICRLSPDQRDIAEDAHRLCRFGQWYYNFGIAEFERNPGFVEIGIEHERMHQAAAHLLRATMDGTPIATVDYERFVSALKRLRLEIATAQHELRDALYNVDPLTGTPSRIGMLTKLREEQVLVKRKLRACVIAMMDLDRFKTVNDTYGHVVGDKVLIAVSAYIMAHLRPYDRLFRYGGEEFLVCLPDTDLQTGHAVIDRLREELGGLSHEAQGRDAFHITTSFGLTLLDADMPVELSIERADKALYAAKAAGRNRSVIWDSSMSTLRTEPEASA
ncbi:diguanylate cyclase [Dongia sp.]|uniref:diguanylate cyclase n=1 Tax=Dongia sp. TaxID=1977262 RepID=UPI0035ADC5AA